MVLIYEIGHLRTSFVRLAVLAGRLSAREIRLFNATPLTKSSIEHFANKSTRSKNYPLKGSPGFQKILCSKILKWYSLYLVVDSSKKRIYLPAPTAMRFGNRGGVGSKDSAPRPFARGPNFSGRPILSCTSFDMIIHRERGLFNHRLGQP
jgi:hypothetical protein